MRPSQDIAEQPPRNRKKRNVGLSRIDEIIEENTAVVGDIRDDEVEHDRSLENMTEGEEIPGMSGPCGVEMSQIEAIPVTKTKSIVTQTDFSCKCFPSGKQQPGPIFDTDSESEDEEDVSEITDPTFTLLEGWTILDKYRNTRSRPFIFTIFRSASVLAKGVHLQIT